MKQVLQNLKTGQTEVIDVPVPTPGRGEALVRNAASLVSVGTERMLVEFAARSLVGKARSRPDLVRQVLDKARREGLLTTIEAALNRLDQPLPLGYSSSGVITALGHNLSAFHIGQRVACSGGGYAVHAEVVRVPGNLLTPLPENVDFESAAFTTLGAIALHGFRLAGNQLGERVAVIGLGLLGLLAVQIARAAGCQVMGIDLDPNRVALAYEMGIPAVLRAEAESTGNSFTRGSGFDAILICADTSSADPVELAGVIARDRARVIAIGAVGLNIPRKVYYEKELTFLNSRSYGPGRYDPQYEEGGMDYPIGYVRWTEGRNLGAFVDLVSGGKVDVKSLVSHRFPIASASQAYELITNKDGQPFLGVLLTYPPAEESPSDKTDEKRVTYPQNKGQNNVGNQLVRLGVLGAGNFAQAVMLPAIQRTPNIELVGITSASGVSASHAAKRYGFRYASSDEVKLMNDPDVNTVAILTRHNLHAGQVINALHAGKNVFCEKPLALNKTQLDEIMGSLSRVDQAGDSASPPVLMVGYNRRFAPLSVKLKRFLDKSSEPLVMMYRINAGYLPPTHWTQDPEIGGGRIIGEACHFVDYLTFLVGEPPISVQAAAMQNQGLNSPDTVVMTFSFPDGSIGTVSYLSNGDKAFPKERVEVFTNGMVAVLDDFRSLEFVQNGRRTRSQSRLRQDKGHQAEWQVFVNSILQGGPPPIAYQDLFGVMQAVFASLEALQTGETVHIPGHIRD